MESHGGQFAEGDVERDGSVEGAAWPGQLLLRLRVVSDYI